MRRHLVGLLSVASTVALAGCGDGLAPLPTTTYGARTFNGTALPTIAWVNGTDTVRVVAATLSVQSDKVASLTVQTSSRAGVTSQQSSLRVYRSGATVELTPVCGGPSTDCIAAGFRGQAPTSPSSWELQSLGSPFPVGTVLFTTGQSID